MKRWMALAGVFGIVAMVGCGAKKMSAEGQMEKTMEAPKASMESMDKPTSMTASLAVEGLMCNNCANTVASAIKGVPGVASAEVDLGGKSATVSYDPTKTDAKKITAAVNGTKHLHDPSKTYMATVK